MNILLFFSFSRQRLLMSRTYSLKESDETRSLEAPAQSCVQADGPDLPGRGGRKGPQVRELLILAWSHRVVIGGLRYSLLLSSPVTFVLVFYFSGPKGRRGRKGNPHYYLSQKNIVLDLITSSLLCRSSLRNLSQREKEKLREDSVT